MAVGNETEGAPSFVSRAPTFQRADATAVAVELGLIRHGAWDVEAAHLLARAAVDMAVCELADVVAGNARRAVTNGAFDGERACF